MMILSSSRARHASVVALALFGANAAVAQTPTARIVTATNAFLSTLDQQQRGRLLFAFDDDKQRAHWSNFPNQMVRRSGLSLGELSAAQRSAAMAVVSSALSTRGVFENTHHARIAAYLVNALVPNDPTIRIAAQKRTFLQSSYDLDFAQTAAGTQFVSLGSLLRWAVVLCCALALSVQLVMRPRRAIPGGS